MRRGSGGKSSGASRGRGSAASGGAQKKPRPTAQRAPRTEPARPVTEEPRTLRLGAVPGATPGRWIDTWQRRFPHVRLELVPLSFAGQRAAIVSGDVDLALVRAPFDRAGMHAIPLYDEIPVVIAAAESHLLAADELDPEDLAGEILLTSAEDALGELALPTAAASIPPLDTVADVVGTVAAGVGIAVVPMSLARLHHRKDVDYRVLRGGPVSPVILAWPADRTSADIEAFVGIVRGRTANSSR